MTNFPLEYSSIDLKARSALLDSCFDTVDLESVPPRLQSMCHRVTGNSWIVEAKEDLECRPCGLHGHNSCPKGHFKCSTSISTKSLLDIYFQAAATFDPTKS